MSSAVEQGEADHLGGEVERCRKWIQEALDHGGNTHEVEDILQGIRENRFQFWAAEKAMFVTEILTYPNFKTIHSFLIGGDLDQVMEMRESIEEFGKRIGCKFSTGNGRRGWVRVMEQHGYTLDTYCISKNLSEEG